MFTKITEKCLEARQNINMVLIKVLRVKIAPGLLSADRSTDEEL